MSFQPHLYIGCEEPLCLVAQMEAGQAQPVELARRDLEPFGDLLPSQNPAELVTALGLCFTS